MKAAVHKLKHKKTKAQEARIAKAKADAKKALEDAMKPEVKKVVKKKVVVKKEKAVKAKADVHHTTKKTTKKPCGLKKIAGGIGAIDKNKVQVVKVVNVSRRKFKKMKAKVKAKLVKKEKKAKFMAAAKKEVVKEKAKV